MKILRKFQRLIFILLFTVTSKANDLKNIEEIEPNIEWHLGRFNQNREFKIYEWAWTGTRWKNISKNVCLATQTLIGDIYKIEEISDKWSGPVSIAILLFSDTEILSLVQFINHLRKCNKKFKENASVHIVVPAQYFSNSTRKILVNEEIMKLKTESVTNLNCEDSKGMFREIIEKNLEKKLKRTSYSTNMLRNIARKTCSSDFVLTSNIDVVYPQNSSYRLKKFLETQKLKCERCIYVVPVFELKKAVEYPQTKTDLKNYLKNKISQIFLARTFPKSIKKLNFQSWIHKKSRHENIRVYHALNNISTSDKLELFYVSSDKVPKHDERFIGNGHISSFSQLIETIVSGWEVKVLTPIFGIHSGFLDSTLRKDFKNNRGKHEINSYRRKEEVQNVKNYEVFVKQIYIRHGRGDIKQK